MIASDIMGMMMKSFVFHFSVSEIHQQTNQSSRCFEIID
jgi:hypothetical protein